MSFLAVIGTYHFGPVFIKPLVVPPSQAEKYSADRMKKKY